MCVVYIGGVVITDISKAISKTAYKTYEKRLLNEVKNDKIPNHIAIIMDGNRRFAQRLGLMSINGHIKGRDKLNEMRDWFIELGIKNFTVYAFSKENFKRNTEEKEQLMRLFAESFKKAGDDEWMHKHKVKIKALGQIKNLPKDVQDAIRYAEEQTKDYCDYFYNVAVAYGSREEILEAIGKICASVKEGKLDIDDINEKLFSSYLYTNNLSDPDLILRTSGEERVSNFLLWQLAYSHLSFVEVCWPEFRKIDFLRAIRSYQKREKMYINKDSLTINRGEMK